jgi:hypothetical protein
MHRRRSPLYPGTREVVRPALLLSLVLALFALPAVAFVASALPASATPPTATTSPSSQGTDFWVTFESNFQGGNKLFLFISGNTATTGTVSDSAIGFSTTFSVTPGVATSIPIPSNAEIDSSDTTVTGGALHVTAGAPVSAYGLNTFQFTSDGFLGLPTPILGSSYLVQDYTGVRGVQFAAVGTQNGTTVTITPSATTGPHTAGVPYTVTLNQGDVYQLIADVGVDLAGTTVTSNLPVAVFAGSNCGDVPVGAADCNTLAEEMMPTNIWGTDFLTYPFATRSGDTFRIMASANATTVNINGSAVATLNRGQFYETVLSTASTITANSPIQVMQYSNGNSFDGNANTDPFMVTVPPTEQFLNSYTVSSEPAGADPDITQNYLNIVAPTSEVAGITLDSSPVPAADFTAIPGSVYSGAQIAVGFGSHTISASSPFGLTVYGYGPADGYGYPGGFTLSPTATGAFLIGDKSAGSLSIGTNVNFWGAQWAKTNTLSGGSAPAALKGFAYSPTAAACGVNWSIGPGNSASPPATLPSQIPVIVTSNAAKSGSTISGNTVHVVLVNVGPGYAPDPGHPGNGTIAATIC